MSCEHNPNKSAIAWVRYPSLLQQLSTCLATAIASLDDAGADLIMTGSMPLEVMTSQPGLFRSPIALQLASRMQQPAMRLGRQILTHVHQQLHPGCSCTIARQLEARLWLQSPGWIYIQCSEQTLATWLQQVLCYPPTRIPQPWAERLSCPPHSPSPLASQSPNSEQLFRIQCAHARCCALLRLAQQEKLLTLPIIQPSLEPILDPIRLPLIPWLDRQQHLRLQLPAERALINLLLRFPASLIPQSQVRTTGADQGEQSMLIPLPLPLTYLCRDAQIWTNHLLRFDRESHIFGEVSAQVPALAQARLGLVSATQAVLAFLLGTLLQTDAPIEL
jgi:hypothetical protein